MGLLDSFLSKEKKTLSKAKKGIEKADALEKSGRKDEAKGILDQTGAMLRENLVFVEKLHGDFSVTFAKLGERYLILDNAQ
ncbi:MAG: hypothetical protein MUO84_05130, partial [Thermoplasmata archaeon]|nr:hypothetical protein [Thermoplasmata archaeon]